MSNGLTFEIFYTILRIFHHCFVNSKWPLQNFKEISSKLTDKSAEIMRSWFNVTLVIFTYFHICEYRYTQLIQRGCRAAYILSQRATVRAAPYIATYFTMKI